MNPTTNAKRTCISFMPFLIASPGRRRPSRPSQKKIPGRAPGNPLDKLEFMSLSPGKLQHMKALSNDKGIIAAAAMDQRGSLKKSIAAAKGVSPDQVTQEQMEEFKVVVSRVLTPHASSILLDPEFGVEQDRAGMRREYAADDNLELFHLFLSHLIRRNALGGRDRFLQTAALIHGRSGDNALVVGQGFHVLQFTGGKTHEFQFIKG